jgi:hypothetical protein
MARTSLRAVAWISVAHLCLVIGLTLISLAGSGEAFERGEVLAPRLWRTAARAGVEILSFPGSLVIRAIRAGEIVDWCIGLANSGLWGLAVAATIDGVRRARRSRLHQ